MISGCFVTETSRFYIDGKAAGGPKNHNLHDLANMRTIHLGYEGKSSGGSKCNCDMTEVEIYKEVLTEQEIFDSYSRLVTGPDCPVIGL